MYVCIYIYIYTNTLYIYIYMYAYIYPMISKDSRWYLHDLPLFVSYLPWVNGRQPTPGLAGAGLAAMSPGVCPGVRDAVLRLIPGDRGRSCVNGQRYRERDGCGGSDPELGYPYSLYIPYLMGGQGATCYLEFPNHLFDGKRLLTEKIWTGENEEMKGDNGTSWVSHTCQVVVEVIEGFKGFFWKVPWPFVIDW